MLEIAERAETFLQSRGITFEGFPVNEAEDYSAKLRALLVDFASDMQQSSARLRAVVEQPVEYRFGPYTLRMATAEDAALAEKWIQADPFHRERVSADFFTKEEPGVGCYVLLDHDGPIFFFRTENAVRVHIQFADPGLPSSRERNRDALRDGMDWLALQLAARSIYEILFDSNNPILRRMTEKRLSFVAAPDDLRRSLAPERAYVGRQKMLRDAQHNNLEGGE